LCQILKFKIMKKFITVPLLFISFCFSSFLVAQNYDYLDRNQIKALIKSDGSLFNNNSQASFEVPKGMGISTIYSANLWIAGIDETGILSAAGPTYQGTEEYYYGPVANDYSNDNYKNRYNRVWKVSLAEIQNHINNFNQPGYEMPEAFLNWPAAGNTANGEAAELAPYYDYNENGMYDPQNGDFPLIRGDQAVYFIFNDASGHNNPEGTKLGYEFHGMAYCFNPSIGSALPQTVFINYRIINRSLKDYNNLYVGLWNDFSLGYEEDDCIGTDSVNKMVYVYNAYNEDAYGVDPESIDVNTYGSPAPAQGLMLLSPEIQGAVVTPYSCCYDTVIYNYLRSLNHDGTPFHYGGTGYVTNFYNPGSSYAWDAKALISAGPYNLNSGEEICLDFAYVYARDLSGTNLTAISFLREKAAALQKFFDDYGFSCNNNSLGIAINNTGKDDFVVYPNPATGIVNIDFSGLSQTVNKVTIRTADGKIVQQYYSSELPKQIDLQVKGLYIISVETSNGIISKKVSIL